MRLNIGKTATRYYCAGCRKIVIRNVRSRKQPYYSFCATRGKGVKLRLLKDQP